MSTLPSSAWTLAQEQDQINDQCSAFGIDGDDNNNEDLATHIAKRRRQSQVGGTGDSYDLGDRNPLLSKIPKPRTGHDDGAEDRELFRGIAEDSRSCQELNNDTQLQASRTLADERPSFESGGFAFDFPFQGHTPIPDNLFDDEESLFVGHTQDPVPTIADLTTNLALESFPLTSDAGIGNNEMNSDKLRHKVSSASDAMADAFQDGDFAASPADNIYQNDLLSHQPVPRKDAYARVNPSKEPVKKRKRPATTHKIAARVKGRQISTNPANELDLEREKVALSTAASTTISEDAHEQLERHEASSKSNGRRTTLEAFIKSRIKGCDSALTRYGYKCDESSAEWPLIKSDVEATAQHFANMVNDTKELDSGLRRAVDEWDHDLRAQVVKKKQIMYTTLLSLVQRLPE